MAAVADGDPSPTVAVLIEVLKPFNKTGAELKPGTRFSEDLNFDSLVVMEFETDEQAVSIANASNYGLVRERMREQNRWDF